MKPLGEFSPVTIALGAAAGCGAVALLAVLLPATFFLQDTASANVGMPHMTALPPSDVRPFEDYNGVFERPLFNPGRQSDPKPAAEAAKSQMPALSDYRLVGIVLMKGVKLGLVERRSAKQVVTVHQGDTLDGRRIDDIGPDGIRFSGAAAPELLAMPRVNGISRSGSKDVAAGTDQ
jgi:hypothetical protein